MRTLVLSYLLFLTVACNSATAPVTQGTAHQEKQSTEQISQAYLAALPDYPHFAQSGLDLQLVSTRQDDLGMTHHRYIQRYQGIPLLDSEILTHVREGKVYRMDGALASIKVSSTAATLTGQQALTQALQLAHIKGEHRSSQKLVIATSTRSYDRLAWLVTLNSGLRRLIYLIDANSGALIREIDGMPK